MAFLSDAGREFLANQSDEPGLTQKEHDDLLKQLQHFESWSRRKTMAEMAAIDGRSRDALINEAIDEWLAKHAESYWQREAEMQEHLDAIKALKFQG
tara:strand:+ start:165 stop:455 length:291 start_codon:yes stop_codon:yes gene_type:complete